jgi:hypothetical protein
MKGPPESEGRLDFPLHPVGEVRIRRQDRPGWGYYAAIVLFVGVLAFAVLGLVRSTSFAGASNARRGSPAAPTPTPGGIHLLTGTVPTPQIPPPTPSTPTRPPSRTYLYPPPELGEPTPPAPAGQPR